MSGCGRLRVGTSGYQYRHWRDRFYPADLHADQWFGFYARRFDSIELNATFYGLPGARSFDRWRQQAPPGFRFATKLSRYVTHMKKLRGTAAPLRRFLTRVERLGARLGPILVQLPPNWSCDVDRIDGFLRAAPRRHRYAVEVRDPSWLQAEFYGVLRAHQAALVIHDALPDHPFELTADWTYLRFHGDHYRGGYSPQLLTARARRVAGWLQRGVDVYAYFNNDQDGHAPRDAGRLARYVDRRDARGR